MPAERAAILSRFVGRVWIFAVLLGASTAVFAQATAQVLREQDGRYLDERVLANN